MKKHLCILIYNKNIVNSNAGSFWKKKRATKAGVRINANECSTKIKYTRKQRTTILYIFFIHAPKVKKKKRK